MWGNKWSNYTKSINFMLLCKHFYNILSTQLIKNNNILSTKLIKNIIVLH
jgi:hypothetical protein